MNDADILNSKCPENKGGGRHFFTQKMGKKEMILSCVTCKKTPETILKEAKAEADKD